MATVFTHALQIRSMVEQGVLSYTDIDSRLVSEMQRYTPSVAIRSLEEFGHENKKGIKNVSAYLHGIVKRLGSMKQTGALA
jgi:membrane-bound lytic murein transglycosylase MltF